MRNQQNYGDNKNGVRFHLGVPMHDRSSVAHRLEFARVLSAPPRSTRAGKKMQRV